MRRHKAYAFINIAGLSLGLACCLILLTYIRHELNYDATHEDADRIFRVAQENPAGIKMAFSDRINEGYVYQPGWIDFEPRSCEAPNVWKRIGEDKWVLMVDIFSIRPHNFGFYETSDFVTFTNLGHFNKGVMKTTNFTSPKHGTVIQITKKEAQRLAEHWGTEMEF